MTKKPKTIIGWEEWCALPELGLPAVKAKIDTGAKTSAIHAYDIRVQSEGDKQFVHFKIHPLQHNDDITRKCKALLTDQRAVISSNGEREKRYVITTPMVFGKTTIDAELTLTCRREMAFRMLLGREALKKARFIVDPSKALLLGKVKNAETLY